jgi:hypothetical protein
LHASKLIRNIIFIVYLKNIEPFDFITILSLVEEESCKPLAEWSRHPSSTFQVPTSSGNEFSGWVKKISSPLYTSKHKLRFCPVTTTGRRPGTYMGLCDICVRVGEGFRVFSTHVRKSSSINTIPEGGSYPTGQVFFLKWVFL